MVEQVYEKLEKNISKFRTTVNRPLTLTEKILAGHLEDEFLNKISNSSMGLNLSRGKPVKYYSSDRISQLIGNGLLTFIDINTKLDDFFTKDQIVFYEDLDDLSYKLNKFKRDVKERKRIAKNGNNFYLKNFNSSLVSDFILSKTLDIKSKKQFIWDH